MLREWTKGSDGNYISSSLKDERRTRFESIIEQSKVFNQHYTLKNKPPEMKLTYEAAMKLLSHRKDIVEALEFPDARETTRKAWDTLATLIQLMNKKELTSNEIEQTKRAGEAAMEAFTQRWLSDDVTRYIHMLTSHLWELQSFGLETKTFLYHYSGHQLESLNLQHQRYFHLHSLRGGISGRKPKKENSQTDTHSNSETNQEETNPKINLEPCDLNSKTLNRILSYDDPQDFEDTGTNQPQQQENEKKRKKKIWVTDEECKKLRGDLRTLFDEHHRDCEDDEKLVKRIMNQGTNDLLRKQCVALAVSQQGNKLHLAIKIKEAFEKICERKETLKACKNFPVEKILNTYRSDIGWNILLFQSRRFTFRNSLAEGADCGCP
jgi:hypothetical protein